MHSNIPKDSIVFQSDRWFFVEPQNFEEAIQFGRDQWCTGRADNRSYESSYNLSRGRLVIFYRKDKPKPQYQAFFSPRGTEFRDGGNLYASLDDFLKKNEECESYLRPLMIEHLRKADSFLVDFDVNDLRSQGFIASVHIDRSFVLDAAGLHTNIGDNFDVTFNDRVTDIQANGNINYGTPASRFVTDDFIRHFTEVFTTYIRNGADFIHNEAELPPNPRIGHLIYREDLGQEFVYTGEGWCLLSLHSSPLFDQSPQSSTVNVTFTYGNDDTDSGT